jgi:hypothetical protein
MAKQSAAAVKTHTGQNGCIFYSQKEHYQVRAAMANHTALFYIVATLLRMPRIIKCSAYTAVLRSKIR